jgi:hypothetical protein
MPSKNQEFQPTSSQQTVKFEDFKNSLRLKSIYKAGKKTFKEMHEKEIEAYKKKIKAYEEKEKKREALAKSNTQSKLLDEKEREKLLKQIEITEDKFVKEEKKTRELEEAIVNLETSLKEKDESFNILHSSYIGLEEEVKTLRMEKERLKQQVLKLQVGRAKNNNNNNNNTTPVAPEPTSTGSSLFQSKDFVQKITNEIKLGLFEDFKKEFMKEFSTNLRKQEPIQVETKEIDMGETNDFRAGVEEQKTPENILPEEVSACDEQDMDVQQNHGTDDATIGYRDASMDDVEDEDIDKAPQENNDSLINDVENFPPLNQLIKNNQETSYKYTEIPFPPKSSDTTPSPQPENKKPENKSPQKTLVNNYPQPSIPCQSVQNLQNSSVPLPISQLPKELMNLKTLTFFKAIGDIDARKRSQYEKFFQDHPQSFGDVCQKIIKGNKDQPHLFCLKHEKIGTSAIYLSLMEVLDLNVFGGKKDQIETFIKELELFKNTDHYFDIATIVKYWLKVGMNFSLYGYSKEKAKRV